MAIAGAYDHSLALKNNGQGWPGATTSSAIGPCLLVLNNLVAVAGGESYSLALKNNGTVADWGVNIFMRDKCAGGLE